MVQRLKVRLERQLPVTLQRDHMSYRSVPVTTDTGFSKGNIHAVAARYTHEDDVRHHRLELGRQASHVAVAIRRERYGEAVWI